MRLVDRLVEIADRLVEVSGVVAVCLGGSRARGAHSPGSDYDLDLYHRPPPDTAALRLLAAELTEPGGWGRAGRFEIGADPGGELHALREQTRVCPEPLREALIDDARWEAPFILAGARKGAARGDVFHVAGCLFRAVGLLVHALHAHARRWCSTRRERFGPRENLPSPLRTSPDGRTSWPPRRVTSSRGEQDHDGASSRLLPAGSRVCRGHGHEVVPAIPQRRPLGTAMAL